MKLFNTKNLVLSTQHALAMFGGTILVPLLMGLSPALGLFCAGIGTIIYHLVTKNSIPIFLGSSAAYLGTFMILKSSLGMSAALGSFVGAAATYFIVGGIVALIGYKKVMKLLPPTVAGSIIIVIGITLIPYALSLMSTNYLLALITAGSMFIYCIINKGPFKVFPVLLAIITGYVAGILMGVVNFAPIAKAAWFSFPQFIRPTFNFSAIWIMAIIALVSMLEHVGELTTNGMVVGKNHFENPGLHRSLWGDAISLLIAGLFGGVPTTTYGENTGVIAITKNSNPTLIVGAGIIALILSFLGKFGAIVSTIPLPVVGGISFMLFGMITMAGISTLKNANVELMNFKHAVTVFIPIFLGCSSLMANNPLLIIVNSNLTLSGLSLAALTGIILNLVIQFVEKIKEKFKTKECDCEHCCKDCEK